MVCCVCLLVWGFSYHSRIFHSYGAVTIAGEGLQINTFAWHSWPLNSEGFLECNTYCDTGVRLLWSSPRTLDTHVYCRAFVELSLPVFTTQVCRGWDSNTQPSASDSNALTTYAVHQTMVCHWVPKLRYNLSITKI